MDADSAEGTVVRLNPAYSAKKRAVAWSLVVAQLALLAGILWLPGEPRWPVPGWAVLLALVVLAVAALIAVAGLARLGRGLTAPAAQLRTTGVYACLRHPIYSALLLGGAALVVLGGRVDRIWVWVGLLALLLIKTRVEETALADRFAGYRAYAKVTPRLVPNPLRCLASWRRSA